MSRGHHGRRVALATAGLAAATIAACGSSGHQAASASANGSLLTAAECMRSHGVPNFPDPAKGAGGEGFSITATPGSSALTINGISFSGPAFQGAEKACHFFGGGNGPPPISEAQKQAFFAKARCIREHGVPNFPDPTFGPGGHGIGINLPPGLNTDSPAFRSAAKACANVGAAIPHVPT